MKIESIDALKQLESGDIIRGVGYYDGSAHYVVRVEDRGIVAGVCEKWVGGWRDQGHHYLESWGVWKNRIERGLEKVGHSTQFRK